MVKVSQSSLSDTDGDFLSGALTNKILEVTCPLYASKFTPPLWLGKIYEKN